MQSEFLFVTQFVHNAKIGAKSLSKALKMEK